MLNFLVETKNEYTTHLINVLTPLILEGFQTIYKEAQDIAGTNDILKLFQSFLKRIPKWNQAIIETETARILNSTHSFSWLNDLIKATLKANIVVLMYNPIRRSQPKIDRKYYDEIKTTHFIHKLYIECAREFYISPFLLYHNFPVIEIKRNQRECMNLIKDGIREAIRKLLPVKHILETYLGDDMEQSKNDEDFDRTMTEAEEKNLTKLIKKDLAADDLEIDRNRFSSDAKQATNKKDIKSTDDDKTIGSKILEMIKKTEMSSQSATDLSAPIQRPSVLRYSIQSPSETSTSNDSVGDETSTVEELKESIKRFEDSIKETAKQENIDNKIKKLLEKDLADSDLETSLNYDAEEHESKYQEVFSNSNNSKQQSGGKNQKEKSKFFNNYMLF